MARAVTVSLCLLLAAAAAETDPGYRLNTPIDPVTYDIYIKPYFNTGDEKAFTFDGEVSIQFTTSSATKQIKLHSEQLEFSEESITVSTEAGVIQLNNTDALVFDANYTFAYINLQSQLAVNTDYTLKITYKGQIRNDMKGFYRSYYIENGVKKWLGATQMEPNHARKVFPCFDEPALKATFQLTIDRPAHYHPSLTNTKLLDTTPQGADYVRERFHQTPRMSTYLVAFLVSEMVAGNYYENETNNKELGVWSRPDASNQTGYAFDIGIKIVDALGDYFGVDYYSTNEHLKLDHVAVPDFSAGAMENWGLVKYREALLLYVAEESTPYFKYRVAQIVAHETTHMWFGNLVTCHWWSDTWLNEGFANYFQDYITASVEPDVGANDLLVTGSVYAAYDADSDSSSAPISNNQVNSPAEISGHFGTITYQKAGSVIRMMHHLLGDAAFKMGLNIYLTENEFSPGYPNLMYSALQRAADNQSALAPYPGATVEAVMGPWITQAGHPLLTVTVDWSTGKVSLTQKRFYKSPKSSSEEVYPLPITYTSGGAADFTNLKPAFIMTERTHNFTIEGLTHSWVIFNIQETGVYRVNYDDHTWEHLISALKGSDRTQIHHLNRAKVVNDVFALFFADVVEFELVLQVLDTLAEEEHYSVWYAAVRGLKQLRSYFYGTDLYEDIEAKSLSVLEPILSKLGYSAKEGEDTVTQRNRMQLLDLACQLSHEKCQQEALQLFQEFKEKQVSIPPSLRPVSYCEGLRRGGAAEYQLLWARMATTNLANEAWVLQEALGCSSDQASLKKYILSGRDEESPIRRQDLETPLGAVLQHYGNVPLVLQELKENYGNWTSLYPSMDTVLSRIASALHTSTEIAQFETWLSSCACNSSDIFTALQTTKARASWASEHLEGVKYALNSAALLAPTAALVMMLALLL